MMMLRKSCSRQRWIITSSEVRNHETMMTALMLQKQTRFGVQLYRKLLMGVYRPQKDH